jgi:hypothetical protein
VEPAHRVHGAAAAQGLREAPRALEHRQRCEAFVEVADLGLEAKRPQKAPAADAQRQLLL